MGLRDAGTDRSVPAFLLRPRKEAPPHGAVPNLPYLCRGKPHVRWNHWKSFADRCRDADAYRVTLYGSLAATGKGHLTDVAILSVLQPVAPTEIVWKPETVLPFHPNGMLFEGLKGEQVVDSWKIYSIGGGALANETSRLEVPRSIYPLTTVTEIKVWC